MDRRTVVLAVSSLVFSPALAAIAGQRSSLDEEARRSIARSARSLLQGSPLLHSPPTGTVPALKTMIREDYSAGRVITCAGWPLSLTEAALLAATVG